MEDSAQYEEFSNLHAESERNKRVKDDTYKENSKRRLLNNLNKTLCKFNVALMKTEPLNIPRPGRSLRLKFPPP